MNFRLIVLYILIVGCRQAPNEIPENKLEALPEIEEVASVCDCELFFGGRNDTVYLNDQNEDCFIKCNGKRTNDKTSPCYLIYKFRHMIKNENVDNVLLALDSIEDKEIKYYMTNDILMEIRIRQYVINELLNLRSEEMSKPKRDSLQSELKKGWFQ